MGETVQEETRPESISRSGNSGVTVPTEGDPKLRSTHWKGVMRVVGRLVYISNMIDI